MTKELEKETSLRVNLEFITKKDQEKIKNRDADIILKD